MRREVKQTVSDRTAENHSLRPYAPQPSKRNTIYILNTTRTEAKQQQKQMLSTRKQLKEARCIFVKITLHSNYAQRNIEQNNQNTSKRICNTIESIKTVKKGT